MSGENNNIHPDDAINDRLRQILADDIGPDPLDDAELERLLEEATGDEFSNEFVERLLQPLSESFAASQSSVGKSAPNDNESKTSADRALSGQPVVANRMRKYLQPENSSRVSPDTKRAKQPDSVRPPAVGNLKAGVVVTLCAAVMCVGAAWMWNVNPSSPIVHSDNGAATYAGLKNADGIVRNTPLTAQSVATPAISKVEVGDTIQTGPFERRRVTLPDGSVLYVNANTKATVETLRRVHVAEGEVYAEVVPSFDGESREEFVVATEERTFTALGTMFRVRTGNDRDDLVVTQGKVQASDFEQPVTGGQELTLIKKTGRVQPARRAAAVLDWARELMVAAVGPLVPPSEYGGGAIVTVDPNGQETRLALRKYHVDVHIEDGFARTTIDQTYFNATWSRQEGTFYFPLPPDASLSRLAMYVGEDLMEGGMAERDHARNVYERIRYQRRDPALLEWVDGSTFKMRVFPLEARQEKRLIISYTQRLQSAYGKLQYRFPAGHNMNFVRDWSAKVRVKDGAQLAWNSSSHDLRIPKAAGNQPSSDLELVATERNSTMDRDLVVEVDDQWKTNPAANNPDGATRISRTQHENHQYVMIRHRPTLQGEMQRPQRNWVFLCETSGDRNPVLARTQVEVIRTLLKNAEHRDTFSILTGGSRTDSFAKVPVDCSAANVEKAIAWLEKTQLVGALDLGQMLKTAEPFCTPDETHLVHVGSGITIFGERDESELLNAIPSNVRYVGVGVGKRWARPFMTSAADRTGGYATQINPDEQVAWRAFELHSLLNAPRLQNVAVVDADSRVLWHTYSATIAEGEEICAIARLPKDDEFRSVVTIKGKFNGQDWSQIVDFTKHKADNKADYLPRSWARLEIDRLVGAGAADNREEIVTLSKAMYVMSPFTSLLVLENEAMYAEFKVDRGRKDHWALYPCPEKIKIVHEPSAPTPEQLALEEVLPQENMSYQQAWGSVKYLSDGVSVPVEFSGGSDLVFSDRYFESPGIRQFRQSSDRIVRSRYDLFDPITRVRQGLDSWDDRTVVGLAAPGQFSEDVTFWDDWARTPSRNPARDFGAFVPDGEASGGWFYKVRSLNSVANEPGRVMLFADSGIPQNIWSLNRMPAITVDQSGSMNDWFASDLRGREYYRYQGDGAVRFGNGVSIQRGFPFVPSPDQAGFQEKYFLFGDRFSQPLFDDVSSVPLSKKMQQRFESQNLNRLDFLIDGLQRAQTFYSDVGPGPVVRGDATSFSRNLNLRTDFNPSGTRRRSPTRRSSLGFFGEERNTDEFVMPEGFVEGRFAQLFGRPVQNQDLLVSMGDLLAQAPGMQTIFADHQAVVARELATQKELPRGSVDEAARNLIRSARNTGWHSITISQKNAGNNTMIVRFSGDGKFAWNTSVNEGLPESVVCDGKNLWHVYRDIGLAAKRQFTPFHARRFRSLIPWLLPSIDELSIGSDVLQIRENTVAVVPTQQATSEDSEQRIGTFLIFADDGRLSERQLVDVTDMQKPIVLQRTTFSADGTVRVLTADDKVLAEHKFAVHSTSAPDLNPQTDGLVIVPLPYRSVAAVKRDFADAIRPPADMSETTALAMLGAYLASDLRQQAVDLVKERFFDKQDNRIGFSVLLASVCPSQLVTKDRDLRPEVEHSPLAQYLRQHVSFFTGKPGNNSFVVNEDAPLVVRNLATAINLRRRWRNGEATKDRTRKQIAQELTSALEFIGQCTPVLGWSLLRDILPNVNAPELHEQLATAAERYVNQPGMYWAAEHLRIRSLFEAEKFTAARDAYGKLMLRYWKMGAVPPIDTDLRNRFRANGNGSHLWNKLLAEASDALIENDQLIAAFQLASQLRTLEDLTAADTLFEMAMKKLDAKKRPRAALLALSELKRLKQFERADALLSPLLELEFLQQSASLWKYAAEVADKRSQKQTALLRLERALALEFAQRPDTVDLSVIRKDYGNLLLRYEQVADASATLGQSAPSDLAQRVAAAADRWRLLDDDDTAACQIAARIIAKLGDKDLAWDYLTTPLAQRPNEAAPWLSFASVLQQNSEVQKASRAYERAFEAESTNPEILWRHAELLIKTNPSRATEMYRRISSGEWQPRFAATKQKAVQKLIDLNL